jgi:protein-tyrosine phosphatase
VSIIRVFGQAFEYIEGFLNQTQVYGRNLSEAEPKKGNSNAALLIHCHAGRSRSVAVTIGYLMVKLNAPVN